MGEKSCYMAILDFMQLWKALSDRHAGTGEHINGTIQSCQIVEASPVQVNTRHILPSSHKQRARGMQVGSNAPREPSDKAATKICGRAGTVGPRARSREEERAPWKPIGTALKVVPAPWPSYSCKYKASTATRTTFKLPRQQTIMSAPSEDQQHTGTKIALATPEVKHAPVSSWGLSTQLG